MMSKNQVVQLENANNGLQQKVNDLNKQIECEKKKVERPIDFE